MPPPLAVALLPLACAAAHPLHREPLTDSGALHVYVRSLPDPVRRLALGPGAVTATRADGSRVALTTVASDIAFDAPGARLAASGELAPGAYTGLSLVLAGAALRGARGQTEPTVAEDAAEVRFPFAVHPGRASLVELELDVEGSALPTGSVPFRPSFRVRTPVAGPVALAGLVSSSDANTVTIYDRTSGEARAVLATGRGPAGMAIDRERLRAYVALTVDDALEVVDLVSALVVDRLPLAAGDAPVDAALIPDGRLLVVDSGSGTVSVVDPQALTEVDRVRVGDRPSGIAIDPGTGRAFVFNALSQTVSVLGVGEGAAARGRLAGRASPAGRAVSVVATIATDPGPFRGRLDASLGRLYVAHESSPYLSVIDTRTLALTGRVYLGSPAAALRVDAPSGRIYLARAGSSGLEVYDRLSLLPLEEIALGGEVADFTLDAESRLLAVALRSPGRLRLLSLPGRRTRAELDLPGEPSFATSLAER